MSKSSTQVVGRMGELWVELKLLQRGWQVGNFNATTANNKGWDLFAVKGDLARRIRVKAATNRDPVWSWSKGSSRPFPDLVDDGSDFSVIVLRAFEDHPDFYVVPSQILDQELWQVWSRYMSHPKRDGGTRLDPKRWWLFFDGQTTDPDSDRGYKNKWAQYRNGWDELERSA